MTKRNRLLFILQAKHLFSALAFGMTFFQEDIIIDLCLDSARMPLDSNLVALAV